jgi:hypothetical protein
VTRDSELKARILEAARREPSPTRQDVSRQTTLIVAAAVVVDLGLFFLFGGVHLGIRPPLFVVATQAGSCAIALLALWGAFGRGRSMLGRPAPWLMWIAVATPIVLLAWVLSWSALYRDAALAIPGRIGFRCLAFSLALAAWPLALILRARRERNPVAPAATGAARGAAVGALAWVLVSLWCPLVNVSHLAIGHFLPLVVLALLGSWLGKRLTAVRV